MRCDRRRGPDVARAGGAGTGGGGLGSHVPLYECARGENHQRGHWGAPWKGGALCVQHEAPVLPRFQTAHGLCCVGCLWVGAQKNEERTTLFWVKGRTLPLRCSPQLRVQDVHTDGAPPPVWVRTPSPHCVGVRPRGDCYRGGPRCTGLHRRGLWGGPGRRQRLVAGTPPHTKGAGPAVRHALGADACPGWRPAEAVFLPCCVVRGPRGSDRGGMKKRKGRKGQMVSKARFHQAPPA